FHREARAAAVLSHPNLIQVYDAGEQDGMHYFAMEFVEGESLGAKVEREGPMAEQTAVAIAMCVAAALNHAWTRAKLIHRDIKPRNIMLTPDGMVKVCDLGLAKVAGEDSNLTVSGTMMGTPHFIAPEQARGDSDIDTRADIYSLGATLYYLVTGKPPYEADSSMSVMYKHLHDPLPDPRKHTPGLSEGFVRIIRKMMAKEPAQRYQNMVELYDDLERVYQGLEPIAVSLPEGRTTVIRAPASIDAAELNALRRRLWVWRLIGCFGLVVIALVGLAIWSSIKQRQRSAVAPQPKPLVTTESAPQPSAKTAPAAKPKPKRAADTAATAPDPVFTRRRLEALARYQEMFKAQKAEAARRAEEQRKADEEAERARREAQAANAARLAAEEAYRNFLNVWKPLVQQRDYDKAILAAHNAANGKEFEPLKDVVNTHLAMSQSLKTFEEKFRRALPTLQGKPLTFGGLSGTVSAADEKSLTIDKIAGVGRTFHLTGLSLQERLQLILTTLGEDNPDTLVNAAWLALAEGRSDWARIYMDKAKLLDTAGAAKKIAEQFDAMREAMERAPIEAAAAAAIEEAQGLITAGKWQEAGAKLALISKQFAETVTLKCSAERLQTMQDAVIASEGSALETRALLSLDQLRNAVQARAWKRAAQTLKSLDQYFAKTEAVKNARDLGESREQIDAHTAPPATKLPGPTLRQMVMARPGATVHRLAPRVNGRPAPLSELMGDVKDGDGVELDEGTYIWLSGPRTLKDISIFGKTGTLPVIVVGPPKFSDASLRLEAANGRWRFEGLVIGVASPPPLAPAERRGNARPLIELGPGASAEFSQCVISVRGRDSSDAPLVVCAGGGELVLRNCALATGRGIEFSGPQRVSLEHCTCVGGSLLWLGPQFPADKTCAVRLVNNVVFAESLARAAGGADDGAKLPEVLKRLNLEGSHHNVVVLSDSAALEAWRKVVDTQLKGSNFAGMVGDDPPLAAVANRMQMDFRLRPDCPAYHAADDGLMVGVRWPDEFFTKVSQHAQMAAKGPGQRLRGREAP
ncbi:MAG: protein kinase, partial [Verrucomicrobiae bacterium]|nr:protein kinase [Verrucomicrobiae bacterium]